MIIIELTNTEYAQLQCLLKDGLAKHEQDLENTPESVVCMMKELGILDDIASIKKKIPCPLPSTQMIIDKM